MELEGVTFEDKWSTAFSATWESTNTLPTLAFGHYVDRKNPDGPFEACDTNLLLRPNGETYSAKTLAPGYCPLSMLFSDWSRDGVAELRVSNDRHYYVNNGSEQLWDIAETPRLYGEDDGWINHKVWGMGIASRDIDRNGLIDVFLSSMGINVFKNGQAKTPNSKTFPSNVGPQHTNLIPVVMGVRRQVGISALAMFRTMAGTMCSSQRQCTTDARHGN